MVIQLCNWSHVSAISLNNSINTKHSPICHCTITNAVIVITLQIIFRVQVTDVNSSFQLVLN